MQSHSLTGHRRLGGGADIRHWADLSEEEQGWVRAAVEAGGELNDSLTMQAEKDLLATFEERGLTITRPDLEPFRLAMQPYYDTLEEQFGEGSIAAVTGD